MLRQQGFVQKHLGPEADAAEPEADVSAAGDLLLKNAAITLQNAFVGDSIFRAGGDEFYIYAPEYSEKKLERFIEKLNRLTANYNESFNKPYRIELSYGALITSANSNSRLEDLLKISDERMYEMKQAKPNRRN